MAVSWLINGGDPNHLQTGGDPPSTNELPGCFFNNLFRKERMVSYS